MKFKILSSKALAWTYKKNLWFIILSLVTFIFILPISINLLLDIDRESIENLKETFATFLGYDSYGYHRYIQGRTNIAFFAGVLAIISAVSGFSFLHSRKQVDFYHSIPLKRETLIINQIIVSISTILLSYIVALLCTFITGYLRGVLTTEAFTSAMKMFLINSLSTICIYLTTVFAMLITGKVVIGVIGSFVFFAITPAIAGICLWLIELFFPHMYIRSFYEFDWLLALSPITWNSYEFKSSRVVQTLVQLVICIGLVGLSILSYKKRRLESAGKALISDNIFRIVKYVIMFVGSAIISLFMSVIIESAAWITGSFIIVAIIIGIVMEIIYNADFKQMFVRWKDILIVCAVGLSTLLVLHLDIMNIDTWKPVRNELESVAIVSDTSMGSYYDTDKKLETLNLPITDEVYELLEIIWENDYYFTGEYSRGYSRYMDVIVKYNMKNGSTKIRQYYVGAYELAREFSVLHNFQEYRALNYKGLLEEKVGEEFRIFTESGISETSFSSRNMEIRELLYQDLMEMDSNALKTEQQIATLDITYYSSYPIYSGNKRAIEYMDTHGIKYEKLIDELDYEYLDLEDFGVYDYNTRSEAVIETVELEDNIEELLEEGVVRFSKEEAKILHPYIRTNYSYSVIDESNSWGISVMGGEIEAGRRVSYSLNKEGEELAYKLYKSKLGMD